MFLKKLFKRTVTVTTKTSIRFDAYSSPDTMDPSSVSGAILRIITNAPECNAYSISRSDVTECGKMSTDPITGEKIRKNGRYAKIPVVRHTIIISKTITTEVSKKVYKDCSATDMHAEILHELYNQGSELIEKMERLIREEHLSDPWYEFDEPEVHAEIKTGDYTWRD